MLNAETVKSNINKRFDAIFHKCEDGQVKPFVCIVCDEFLKPSEFEIVAIDNLAAVHFILTPSVWNATSAEIGTFYTFTKYCIEGMDYPPWLNNMLLSPRSPFLKFNDRRKKNGLCICQKCNHSLNCKEMPCFAIANNYCFGTPPACLMELTEIELALLTPVKTFGYFFSFTGGHCKQLQGSLSYYKVKIESIVRATMHLDVLEIVCSS